VGVAVPEQPGHWSPRRPTKGRRGCWRGRAGGQDGREEVLRGWRGGPQETRREHESVTQPKSNCWMDIGLARCCVRSRPCACVPRLVPCPTGDNGIACLVGCTSLAYFQKELSIVTLYSKYTMPLTCQNFCLLRETYFIWETF
jgi:hypothetical protein